LAFKVSAFAELLDIFLPAQCALCQRPPSVICTDCLKSFESNSRAVHRGELRGASLFEFDERSSKLIADFKEKGQFAIANLLIDHLVNGSFRETLLEMEAQALVAVPSSSKSFAKRGFVPAQVIANRLARTLGLQTTSKSLWLTRTANDQAGLDQEARAENLVGAMKASIALSGKRVLLVDDIVTTGSSMIEAARAASVVGAEVVGFVTLAETILKIAPTETKRV
jgi:ComF family protein